MKTQAIKQNGARIMDAAVLTFSFILFSLLTGYSVQPGFALLLIAHVAVLYAGLRLGKRLVFRTVELPSPTAAVLAGNLLGLFAGNLVLAALLPVLSLGHTAIVINLIASGASFFILGTLSPIFRDTRSDITAH